jgi:hypothetical protein
VAYLGETRVGQRFDQPARLLDDGAEPRDQLVPSDAASGGKLSVADPLIRRAAYAVQDPLPHVSRKVQTEVAASIRVRASPQPDLVVVQLAQASLNAAAGLAHPYGRAFQKIPFRCHVFLSLYLRLQNAKKPVSGAQASITATSARSGPDVIP